jgi:hypothetical protein
MEIDNLNLLLPFIQPESEDDFYYLQILQRKKENPELGSNSRVIKNYYIKSQDELLRKYDEIKKLCQVFNSRASLRLNKRSFYKVGFKAMENLAHTMANKDFDKLHSSYDRAVGLGHNDSIKKWIIDIDAPQSNDSAYVEKMKVYIENQLPLGNKILNVVPSKTGIHLITTAFDLRTFHEEYPDTDIHKDNPTNLYIF